MAMNGNLIARLSLRAYVNPGHTCTVRGVGTPATLGGHALSKCHAHIINSSATVHQSEVAATPP